MEKWYLIKSAEKATLHFHVHEDTVEEMLAALSCFLREGDHMLFPLYPFYGFDHLSEEEQAEDMDFDFQIYMADLFHMSARDKIEIDEIIGEILVDCFGSTAPYQDMDRAVAKAALCATLKQDVDAFDTETIRLVKEGLSRCLDRQQRRKYSVYVGQISGDIVFANDTAVPHFSECGCEGMTGHSADTRSWYLARTCYRRIKALLKMGTFFDALITGDLQCCENYRYYFEYFEERDFQLAVNDRVGDFVSRVVPALDRLFPGQLTILEYRGERTLWDSELKKIL